MLALFSAHLSKKVGPDVALLPEDVVLHVSFPQLQVYKGVHGVVHHPANLRGLEVGTIDLKEVSLLSVTSSPTEER